MKAALPRCTNVNLKQGEFDRTLLHNAAKGGCLEVVKLLLGDPRVDVRANSKKGCSALHSAASGGCLEVVKLLLEDPRVDVRAVDEEGWSALHFAASGGHVEVVKLLLEDRADVADCPAVSFRFVYLHSTRWEPSIL